MTRPPVDPALWQGWLAHVCAAVGVDPSSVDLNAVHDLAGQVAAVYERPMAPVAAHLWGLARGAHPDADSDVLRDALQAAAREAR